MKYISFLLIMLAFACNSPKKQPVSSQPKALKLTIEEANRLVKLPLACVEVEYPNKLNQVLEDSSQLQRPKVLHPAFYGCFDWHSAVHGYWSMVVLLKHFPNLDSAKVIRQKLLINLSKQNMEAELAYFKEDAGFERTYGWAWYLKLVEELATWKDPMAKQLTQNLQPLTDFIVQAYLTFLPKLNYPIRGGEHPNTAFGLSFAYDYALAVEDKPLKELIEQRAKDFYLADVNCPLNYEPSGFDFLSPCLEEANLMRKILPIQSFETWLQAFLPQLSSPQFELSQGRVSDRKDGKLVHLDGLNFSRAWCLAGIAKTSPKYAHLNKIAKAHINYSLPVIIDENYEGTHWLGSFAIYALLAND